MADDQKALKKRLKLVMSLPHNQICSDCNERQPRWASLIVPPPGLDNSRGLAVGALCCLECSGSHRRLGVHISFVRSINLDSWKEKEVLAMENGGNAKVNAIFEARLPANSNVKPTNHADGPTRERFIRDKYERRKYYDPSAADTFHDAAQSNGSGTRGTVSEGAASSVGPPSDAAKQRLEQRRARINEGLSAPRGTTATMPTATSVANTKSRPTVAKAPASAPVDLLGFDTPTAESSIPTASKVTTAEFDLFDFSSTAGTSSASNGTTTNNSSSVDDQWNQLTAQASQPQQQVPVAKPSIDLASLYNGVQQQQQQQQQPMGFANFGPGSNMGYAANNPNPMMMNNNNTMQQMNMAMHNMNFSNQHLTPQQIAYQQQQMLMMQQQQQQHQMMLQQQMMMQQQQQFPNTTMNHFGSSPNPAPTKVTTSKVSAAPEKDDPFAQFGTNMFR